MIQKEFAAWAPNETIAEFIARRELQFIVPLKKGIIPARRLKISTKKKS